MLAGRVKVIAVSAEGLVLVREKARWQAPWSAIESVAAGMLSRSQSDILVLAIGLDDGRVIMISEIEPIWLSVTGVLADYLPGIERFDDWASRLVSSDPELLYERQTDRTLPN